MSVSENHLCGVEFSENQEALILEREFEIKFEPFPLKIELTPRNKFCMGLNTIMRRKLELSLSTMTGFSKPRNPGKYVSEYNSIVVRKQTLDEEASLVAVHENMHAYIDQVNPDFTITHEDYYNAVGHWEATGEITEGFDTEKWEVYRCFEEGICEWSSYEIMVYLAGVREDPDILDETHRKGIRRLDPSISVPTLENEYVEKLADGVNDRIRQLRELQDGEPHEFYERFVSDLEDEKYAGIAYKLGHYFVYVLMKFLRESDGKSIRDSLDFLITNPPTKVDHLQYPYLFYDYVLNEID